MKTVPTTLSILGGILIAAAWFKWQFVLDCLAALKQNDTTAAIVATALLGAAVAIWGVISQRAIARRQVTYEQITKSITDKDIIEARHIFIELSKKPGGMSEWAAADKEATTEAQGIVLTMNTFEIFSIGIQKGIIDYYIFKQWNRSTVIQYWNHAQPYAAALRARLGNDLIFHEFEQLAHWFKSDGGPKRRGWKMSRYF